MTEAIEWVLACIAEDEAVARACYAVPPWHAEGYFVMNHTVITETDEYETTAHIARWHPDRVLAECEAKRALLDLAELGCGDDHERVLRAVALPFVDRPGYAQAFRFVGNA